MPGDAAFHRHIRQAVSSAAVSGGLFFEPRHCLSDRREQEDDDGDGRLGEYVNAVVYERLWEHTPAFPGISAEKDAAGDDGKEISAGNACQIALDQAIAGVGKDTGEPESAESQQIIDDELGRKENIGIDQQLLDSVSDTGHQSCAETEPIAGQTDDEHGEHGDRTAGRKMKQFQIG